MIQSECWTVRNSRDHIATRAVRRVDSDVVRSNEMQFASENSVDLHVNKSSTPGTPPSNQSARVPPRMRAHLLVTHLS